MVRITYSTVAYVECSKDIANEIIGELDCIATGNGQAVVNFETLNDWVYDEDNKEETLYKFLKKVRNQINTDNNNDTNGIGEIIFSY
jgi:hypothetical protein